jgi:stage V sporulation protein B
MAELLWLIPQSLAANLLPKTAGDNPTAARRFTPQVVKGVMVLVTLGAMLLGLASPLLITFIFSDSFASSVEPLRWLLPGVVALSISKVLSADLVGRGKPHYGGFASSAALVVTLVSDFTLIPYWGIKGAAIASSLSYVTLLFVNLWLYMRESGNSIPDMFLIRRKDIQLCIEGVVRARRQVLRDLKM